MQGFYPSENRVTYLVILFYLEKHLIHLPRTRLPSVRMKDKTRLSGVFNLHASGKKERSYRKNFVIINIVSSGNTFDHNFHKI